VLYPHKDRNVLALFDSQSGKHLRTLDGPKDNLSSHWEAAEFSPDGRVIVGQKSGSWNLWFWDPESGKLLGSFKSPVENEPWSQHQVLSFSPDSKRLAVAVSRFVHIVDVANRTSIRDLRGHEGQVTALTFSPDGARILTGSADKTAALWNADTGQLLSVYRGHAGTVNLIAYSPDGTRVATSTESELMARVWPVDVVPAFEKRKPRELTPAERVRFELQLEAGVQTPRSVPPQMIVD
jgi:WD40 repeat protein